MARSSPVDSRNAPGGRVGFEGGCRDAHRYTPSEPLSHTNNLHRVPLAAGSGRNAAPIKLPGSGPSRMARQLLEDWPKLLSMRGCLALVLVALQPMAAQPLAARLGGSQGVLGAPADQRAFLLGQRRVDVEQEGIRVGTELGHDSLDR